MTYTEIQMSAAVLRASRRAACLVYTEMHHGLAPLASITTVAPLVATFGTVLGIIASFRGVSGEKWSIYAAVMESLSNALIPIGFGLLIAIPSAVAHKHFRNRIRTLNLEMETTAWELARRCAARVRPGKPNG